MNFDEINSLEEYFEPMEISDLAKAQRIELAELLLDAVLFFFYSFITFTQKNYNKGKNGSRDYFVNTLYDKFADAVLEVTGMDEYISKRIRKVAEDTVDTTIKNNSKEVFDTSSTSTYGESLSPSNGGSPIPLEEDSGYNLSMSRGFFIAADTANAIMNYTDFAMAKADGMRRKQWITLNDEKVRNTHEEVNNQVIDIDDVFIVGGSIMRFPKDEMYLPNPKETIRCRCSIRYLR